MGDKRFPDIDEATGEAIDNGSPPIPKTGVAGFDRLSEPEKIRGLQEIDVEPMAGVIRQVLARPDDQLTAKQEYTYRQAGKAAIEKCSTCSTIVPRGDVYCPTCEIEYGGR